ncbi:MAG: response regulator [Acidobacteriota bacterium]
MLAEDNPADIFLVREALNSHNIICELEVISDGDQALRHIDCLDSNQPHRCPALLLLDMHLPKRDGEAILRHLRASEHGAKTPVIIMTSSESPALKNTAEKNAALHYFRKPSKLDEFMMLGVLIKDVLDARPATSQS